MSEYRYKPQYDQVKFLSKQPSTFAKKYEGLVEDGSETSDKILKKLDTKNNFSSDKDGIFQPRNIMILVGLIAFLLLLWFFTRRRSTEKSKSLVSNFETISQNLKRLEQQQQRLLSAQQNQLELIQTNSMRNDELFKNIGKDFRQTLSMLMLTTSKHPQQLILPPVVNAPSPPPSSINFNSFNVPRGDENNNHNRHDDDDDNDGGKNIINQCQEDGTGICSEFGRRQPYNENINKQVSSSILQPPIPPPSNHLFNSPMLPKLTSAMPNSGGPRSR